MDYLDFSSVTFSGVFLSLKIVNGFLRMFKHYKYINKFETANNFYTSGGFFSNSLIATLLNSFSTVGCSSSFSA